MNQKLFGICQEIPDALRKRDLGAYFRSIHGTLNHILWADRTWLGRFAGAFEGAWPIGVDVFDDFATLAVERRDTDRELTDWVTRLSPQDLGRRLMFRTSGGKLRRGRLWHFVSHCFNHPMHHRGQVTTLVKQLGHDPGVTDLPATPGVSEMEP